MTDEVSSQSSLVSELWLDEFGTLTNHITHGLRNALQGVGINLEVIRSRAEHGGADTSDLRTFAMNAARQFEDLSSQVEALAYLSRKGRGKDDVGATVKSITTLLNAGGNGRVSLQEADLLGRAAISPAEGRLILTHVILAAVATGSRVACVVHGSAPVSVALTLDPSAPIELRNEVLSVAQSLHVRIDTNAAGVTVTFPTTLSSDTVLV